LALLLGVKNPLLLIQALLLEALIFFLVELMHLWLMLNGLFFTLPATTLLLEITDTAMTQTLAQVGQLAHYHHLQDGDSQLLVAQE
jgi:hypothetical protein